MPPAPAFAPKVLQGKGHSLGWGDAWGVERSGEMGGSGLARAHLTCTLRRSAPHGQPRIMTMGWRACCIHPVEPGQGQAGGGGGRRRGALTATPSCFHPTGRRACFSPSSLQGQAEGGQWAEPWPASPSSPAACAPCFAALCHAASIAQSSPGSPPPQPPQSPRATQEETGGVVRLPPQHPSIPASSTQGGGAGGSAQGPPSLLPAAASHPSPH